MKRIPEVKILGGLVLILFSFSFKMAFAQSDIAAIEILLTPDQTLLDSAKVYNNKMLKNYSGHGSFALDSIHAPNITVLQCFVKTSELEKVYAAVAKVVESDNPMNEPLRASGLFYLPLNDLGLAGITVPLTPKLMSFQSKMIEAVKPFIVTGTNTAFVPNADGTPISATSANYVNAFTQENSGIKYNPHVTIGLAYETYLKGLLPKPFHKFSFKCTSVCIYHLGDFGTAQKKLWSSSN